MHKDVTITFDPASGSDEAIRKAAARKLSVSADDITDIVILRKSLDARHHDIKANASVCVYIGESAPARASIGFPDVSDKPSAVVVGAGPAGLFAALTLIENNVRPIVLERGKDVHSRLKDTALLTREGKLDPESNYVFGEGGAGAFSDGKLYTRSSKRGDVQKVLSIFVQHGADPSIMYDAHPHIGTDKLPRIIENMRKTIEKSGGVVRFQSRAADIIRSSSKTIGVRLSGGEEILGPVILATGHSAKDVYNMLYGKGFMLEAKSTAVGVRFETEQSLIDSIQYHCKTRPVYLPPASYSYTAQIEGRGVYSFCMCPGGMVVPSASEEGLHSVNGMSSSSRSGRYANSGIVTEIRKEEIEGSDPFRVLRYIENIERASYTPGFIAPAEKLTDFISDSPSGILPRSTYRPELVPSRLDDVLPDIVVSSLRKGFIEFGRMSGNRLIADSGLLIAAETRTSAPLRIPRDHDMKQGFGLYPAGEGSGYAGGIVSAAIDGTEAAKRLCGEIYG